MSLFNPEEAISEARMRIIVIRGLKPEYIPFVTSIQGWAQQPSLEEFAHLLSSQALLAKQLASVFVKDGEGDALVADKRNFKGKSRDMSHSRSSGGSSLPGKKEEASNYYGKKPLRCYLCGEVGHIKRYCRAKESNLAQKVVEEEEGWENCLVAEAGAINVMVSINLEEDLIDDSEYNAVDHVEQNTHVINMKQETIKDVYTGDMVAFIEEIKEINYEQAVPEAIYADSDLYGENEEADLEGQISGGETVDIIIGSSKDDKQFKELKRECGGGSCDSDEASQEIDDQFITKSNEATDPNKISLVYGDALEGTGSTILNRKVSNLSVIDVYPNSTTVGKLRKRGSLRTQQGDNSHGSITDEKSSSIEEPKGLRKKLLRSSPRHGAKLRLSSSATSVG
uniref:CCHC-type domain-containing protein n=1 Tax=Solanum tuberosum TaxID=4113 RepID=M1DLP9_SOLTU